jgi:sec-independent protein translocase protein TatA
MGSLSIWHWLIVLAVVLVLFGGGGKIPKLMKDLGSGVNQFKKGLREEDKKAGAKTAEDDAKAIEKDEAVASSSTSDDDKKAAQS